nr:hypothetical protein Iba_chr03bCG2420 [Ipomoea batatas]
MVAKNTSKELILFTIIDTMLSNIHERDSENAMSDINSIILTLGPVNEVRYSTKTPSPSTNGSRSTATLWTSAKANGCNPSAGGGGTSTDANEDDSSIPEMVFSLSSSRSLAIFRSSVESILFWVVPLQQVEERALQGQKMVFECDVVIV